MWAYDCKVCLPLARNASLKMLAHYHKTPSRQTAGFYGETMSSRCHTVLLAIQR